MNLVVLLLRSSKSVVIWAILIGALSGAASAGVICLIGTAITNEQFLARWLAVGFFGLALITVVARVGSQLLLIHLAQGAIFKLRIQLSRAIAAAPLAELERTGTPRLLASLTDDVVAISDAMLGIPFLAINLATVAGCLLYMAWLSWTLLVGVLAFLTLGAVSYQLLQRTALARLKAARGRQDELFAHFRALTEGNKELKLHQARRDDFFQKVLEVSAGAFRRDVFVGMSFYTLAGTWAQLLLMLALGLLLFGIPRLTVVDLATLTAYCLTFLYLLRPLDSILQMLPYLGRASVALAQIESLGFSLSKTAESSHADTKVEPFGPFQQLELVDTTYRYAAPEHDRAFHLGPIRLALRPAEVVFIIGGNGSGKSTLAKLLCGLYVAEEGSVTINGVAVDDTNRDAYRQNFSAVFSDFYLFKRLIGIKQEDIQEQAPRYLAQLELTGLVDIQDGQFTTTDLSRGQRKRLALLVAFLEDRPIYVFDEWAADQDPGFKRVFYTTMLPELKQRKKTVVVISHDDAYYHLADRTVKLEDGRQVTTAS